MSILITDPFDVQTDQELDALTRTFYSQLEEVIKLGIIQARIEESKTPTSNDILKFIEDQIFGIGEFHPKNKFDSVLHTMGAETNVHPLIRDRVLFLREFAMRYIVPDRERSEALREELRKLAARLRVKGKAR